MAYDPNKTTAENLADLKAQNEAADREYAKLAKMSEVAERIHISQVPDIDRISNVTDLRINGIPVDDDGAIMGFYDLSTEDWEATPEKVRDILRTLFAFE